MINMDRYYEEMMNNILEEYVFNEKDEIIATNKSTVTNPSFSNESVPAEVANQTMFSWLFDNSSVDEATLPGIENNEDEEDNNFNVPSAGEEDTDDTDDTEEDPDTTEDDTDDANYDVVDTTDDDADTDDTDNDDEGEEDDYNLPDAGDDEGGEDTEDTEGEDDNEFNVDDAGEGGEEGDDTGDGTTDADDAGDTGTGDVNDLIDGHGSGGDGVSDEVQIPNLRDVQQKLFDQLTPEQQDIKVKELKSNYTELYNRCANILKIITDSNPGDENVVRVFDYVQKTMNDLQTHIYYYIANTFDTKTYIENDIQFKQFLVILNTIKNILDEINTEKKE